MIATQTLTYHPLVNLSNARQLVASALQRPYGPELPPNWCSVCHSTGNYTNEYHDVIPCDCKTTPMRTVRKEPHLSHRPRRPYPATANNRKHGVGQKHQHGLPFMYAISKRTVQAPAAKRDVEWFPAKAAPIKALPERGQVAAAEKPAYDFWGKWSKISNTDAAVKGYRNQP